MFYMNHGNTYQLCLVLLFLFVFLTSKSEKQRPGRKEEKKTSIVQITLDNRLISRATARPLARTNETKRFPGWGRCALTPQPPMF